MEGSSARSYAVTSNSSSTNFSCPAAPLPPNFLTCPSYIMRMALIPLRPLSCIEEEETLRHPLPCDVNSEGLTKDPLVNTSDYFAQ
jgi:hypothetical protein